MKQIGSWAFAPLLSATLLTQALASEDPPPIADADRDGWDDAWVASYPDIDLGNPLADPNGDGMPVYLEMHLGIDPFADGDAAQARSAAQQRAKWQEHLLARIEKIEKVKARNAKTLNRGFRDADGNPCCAKKDRQANIATLSPLRKKLRAEAIARKGRVDQWVAERKHSLPFQFQERRPSDIVDGCPKWVGENSHLVAGFYTLADFAWPGSDWIVGDGIIPEVFAAPLTGAGEKIYLWELGPVLESHEQFSPAGRVINLLDSDGDGTDDQFMVDTDDDGIPDQIASPDNHASCVACVLAGSGDPTNANNAAGNIGANSNPERSRGQAYESDLIVLDFDDDVLEIATLIADPASDLHLSNHSYGLKCGWEQPPGSAFWLWHGGVVDDEDENFGKYRAREANLDQVVYVARNYLPVFAAGNDAFNIEFSNTPGESKDHGPGTRFIDHKVVTDNGLVDSSRSRPDDGALDVNDTDPWRDTLAPEATGKNVLTVGIHRYSAGPTDDGRIKPDVVVGNPSVDEDALPFDGAYVSSTTAYGAIAGTSMAAPAVTGSLAMLRQQWFDRRGAESPAPWGSTLKALAIATACDLNFSGTAGVEPGPDYRTGYGRFNAVLSAQLVELDSSPDKLGSCPHIRQAYLPVVPDGPDPGGHDDGVIEFDILRSAETETMFIGQGCNFFRDHFTVTVCWSDPAGDQADLTDGLDDPDRNIVNHLDVVVIGPDNTQYYPWSLDPNNPESPATRTGKNIRDNVEVVQVDVPEGTGHGLYRVQITHLGQLKDGVPEGVGEEASPQPVSIVIAGAEALGPATPETISFEEAGLGGEHHFTFTSVVGATYGLEESADGVIWSPIPGEVLANAEVTTIEVDLDTPTQQTRLIRARNLCVAQ